MGSDKASILVHGRPAVQVMKDRLGDGGCCEVRAVAPGGVNALWDAHASIHDTGEGPLGALRLLLADCTTEWAFVVAVDHLGLSSDAISRLIEVARTCPAHVDVVMAQGGDGDARPQHLISVWRTISTARRVEDMWRAGSRSLVSVLSTLNSHVVDLDARSTCNINTPEDLRAFETNG